MIIYYLIISIYFFNFVFLHLFSSFFKKTKSEKECKSELLIIPPFHLFRHTFYHHQDYRPPTTDHRSPPPPAPSTRQCYRYRPLPSPSQCYRPPPSPPLHPSPRSYRPPSPPSPPLPPSPRPYRPPPPSP